MRLLWLSMLLVATTVLSGCANVRKRFAALGQRAVSRSVLPAFDRARAQSWWQAQ